MPKTTSFGNDAKSAALCLPFIQPLSTNDYLSGGKSLSYSEVKPR